MLSGKKVLATMAALAMLALPASALAHDRNRDEARPYLASRVDASARLAGPRLVRWANAAPRRMVRWANAAPRRMVRWANAAPRRMERQP